MTALVKTGDLKKLGEVNMFGRRVWNDRVLTLFEEYLMYAAGQWKGLSLPI